MIEEIKKRLEQFSLPSRPKTFGVEYQFPEDIDKLASSELGTWMFKLAAWKGYSLKILSILEIERSWLKSQHDNRVSKRIAQDSDDKRRTTKDHALGQLILLDSEFKQIKEKLIIKETELEGLRQILEIYTMQIEVVSREISRRALDVKLMSRGIGGD